MVPEGQWGDPVNNELLTCNHGDENTWHCLEVIRRAWEWLDAFSSLPSTIYSPFSHSLFLTLSFSLLHSTVLIAVQRFFVLLLLLCQESVLDMEIQAGQREEIKRSVPLWELWLWANPSWKHQAFLRQTHANKHTRVCSSKLLKPSC